MIQDFGGYRLLPIFCPIVVTGYHWLPEFCLRVVTGYYWLPEFWPQISNRLSLVTKFDDLDRLPSVTNFLTAADVPTYEIYDFCSSKVTTNVRISDFVNRTPPRRLNISTQTLSEDTAKALG